MELITLTCGIIRTNAYIMFNPQSREAVLIDAPDMSYGKINKILKEKDLTLKCLIVTHGHWDHIFDVYRFQKNGVPVLAHQDTNPYLKNPAEMNMFPAEGLEFGEASIDTMLKDSQSMFLAGMKFRFFDVPGHCPGSIAAYLPEMGICFTGDLIFYGSVGRTDLRGGDIDLLEKSIREKIYKLDDSTMLYPGHGPETTVGQEKRSNPFVPA